MKEMVKKAYLIPFVIVVVLFCSTVVRAAQWTEVDTGTDELLYGVWGGTPDNFYAVGTDTILNYTGGAWNSIPIGTEGVEFKGVWGSSPADVFVVGYMRDYTALEDRSIILHFDGGAWTEMPTGADAWLQDVWGTSDSDVFAVGHAKEFYGGNIKHDTILHYDGSTWTDMNVGTSTWLNSVRK